MRFEDRRAKPKPRQAVESVRVRYMRIMDWWCTLGDRLPEMHSSCLGGYHPCSHSLAVCIRALCLVPRLESVSLVTNDGRSRLTRLDGIQLGFAP